MSGDRQSDDWALQKAIQQSLGNQPSSSSSSSSSRPSAHLDMTEDDEKSAQPPAFDDAFMDDISSDNLQDAPLFLLQKLGGSALKCIDNGRQSMSQQPQRCIPMFQEAEVVLRAVWSALEIKCVRSDAFVDDPGLLRTLSAQIASDLSGVLFWLETDLELAMSLMIFSREIFLEGNDLDQIQVTDKNMAKVQFLLQGTKSDSIKETVTTLPRLVFLRQTCSFHKRNSPRNSLRAFKLCQRYIANLIQQPDNVQFRRIKVNNKVFQQRIGALDQGCDLLASLGFERLVLQVVSQPADVSNSKLEIVDMDDSVQATEEVFLMTDSVLAHRQCFLPFVCDALLGILSAAQQEPVSFESQSTAWLLQAMAPTTTTATQSQPPRERPSDIVIS